MGWSGNRGEPDPAEEGRTETTALPPRDKRWESVAPRHRPPAQQQRQGHHSLGCDVFELRAPANSCMTRGWTRVPQSNAATQQQQEQQQQ
jgi:hypothetical protein